MTDLFSVHADKLDRLITRISGPRHKLWLDQEQDGYHTVTDLTTSQVMWRGPDLNQAESWSRAFVTREGGDVDEVSLEILRGAAQNRFALRQAFEALLARTRSGGEPEAARSGGLGAVSQADATDGEPASPPDHNVIPFPNRKDAA